MSQLPTDDNQFQNQKDFLNDPKNPNEKPPSDAKEYYTKDEINAFIAALTGITDLDQFVTHAEMETFVAEILATELNGYYDKSEIDGLLQGYYTSAQIDLILQNYYDGGTVDQLLSGYQPIGLETYDDLRIDALSARSGVVAPTTEGGFAGDANILSTNFVSNQADEIQFPVQFPHSYKEGSHCHPHIHYSPFDNVADGTYNVKFILEFYWCNVNDKFTTLGKQTFEMSDSIVTVSNNRKWDHLIARNVSDLVMTGFKISNVWKCRLYRDNTVANNFPGKISLTYFDIHIEQDSEGSEFEFSKTSDVTP